MLVALAAATAAAPCQDAASVRLEHALHRGDRFAFVIEVEAGIEFDQPSQNSSMRFAVHFDAEVGASTDGATDVTCTLRRIEVQTASPTARIRYDSADTARQPGSLSQLATLVDERFHVHVAPAGAVVRVDAPARLRELAAERLGADFDALFACWFVPLPTDAVAAETCWTNEAALVERALSGGKPVLARNKLVSVTDGVATIRRTFELPAPAPRRGVRFEVRRAEGRIEFDIAAGRVRLAQMDLEASAAREPGAADGTGPEQGTSRLRVRATPVANATAPDAQDR